MSHESNLTTSGFGKIRNSWYFIFIITFNYSLKIQIVMENEWRGKTIREMFEDGKAEMYRATESMNKAKDKLKKEQERLDELRYAVSQHEKLVDTLRNEYHEAFCKVTELDYRLEKFREILKDNGNENK